MRLLISIIDWKYPSAKENLQPVAWDLKDQNTLMSLILAYGNGIIMELRADGESEEAIQLLRGIATGTGHSNKIELSLKEKENLWLYQEGDECYRQPISEGGYTFINPKPQPQKFENDIG